MRLGCYLMTDRLQEAVATLRAQGRLDEAALARVHGVVEKHLARALVVWVGLCVLYWVYLPDSFWWWSVGTLLFFIWGNIYGHGRFCDGQVVPLSLGVPVPGEIQKMYSVALDFYIPYWWEVEYVFTTKEGHFTKSGNKRFGAIWSKKALPPKTAVTVYYLPEHPDTHFIDLPLLKPFNLNQQRGA